MMETSIRNTHTSNSTSEKINNLDIMRNTNRYSHTLLLLLLPESVVSPTAAAVVVVASILLLLLLFLGLFANGHYVYGLRKRCVTMSLSTRFP